jgi:hypothetical protein
VCQRFLFLPQQVEIVLSSPLWKQFLEECFEAKVQQVMHDVHSSDQQRLSSCSGFSEFEQTTPA